MSATDTTNWACDCGAILTAATAGAHGCPVERTTGAVLSAADVAGLQGCHAPGLAQTGGRLCQGCSSYSHAVYWPCAVVRLAASHEALRQQADLAFRADNDAELAAVCGPCFEGVCACCIEQRGAAGDGQPCRCSHAGWYAEGLRRMAAERDAALNHVEAVRGLAEAAARDANRLEAERDALRVALAWALEEGGWRLWYYAPTMPPGVVRNAMGSPAEWRWPPATSARTAAAPKSALRGADGQESASAVPAERAPGVEP